MQVPASGDTRGVMQAGAVRLSPGAAAVWGATPFHTPLVTSQLLHCSCLSFSLLTLPPVVVGSAQGTCWLTEAEGDEMWVVSNRKTEAVKSWVMVGGRAGGGWCIVACMQEKRAVGDRVSLSVGCGADSRRGAARRGCRGSGWLVRTSEKRSERTGAGVWVGDTQVLGASSLGWAGRSVSWRPAAPLQRAGMHRPPCRLADGTRPVGVYCTHPLGG